MRGIAVNINLQRRREEVFWRQRFHCYFSPPARRRSSDGPGFSTDEALDLLGTRLASVFYGARRAQIEAGLRKEDGIL